ncbi:proton-coupled folate transporter-like [Ostrinia furnacalis]|uniref:proton-coupled folate transporter-like n=1 Tax=Ostrinia furnacalis TaxID=93504 RepID=UPI00103B137B|nr:proton-coupled folate transporter-like [Ostrinia furnacalis]
MADVKKEAERIEENPLNRNAPEENGKKTFRQKLQNVRSNVTVEPMLGGLIIPSVLSRFAMGNLNLDKACRVNLQFGDEVCDALIKKTSTNYSSYEKEVQALIASIDIWKGIIHTALPCIIIMFLGAWSDRTGKRKICILLPVIGELLTSINNLVNVYFFYEIPVQVTVFLETLFPAITGGWVTMFLGVFSYISDITTEESRTFRVGLVNFCMTAGIPIGFALSGIFLSRFGYYGTFSMTAVMFTIALLYGFICLKEPDVLLKEQGLPPIERKSSSDVSFFDTTHVLETIGVAYRRRPSNRRIRLILTLLTVFILYGPAMSEHTVFYLFVRNRLNWDMVKYGLFASYSIVLHSFGAMFSITVLSRRLQVDDSVLCIISIISKFVGSVWTAFVRTDMEMYLVPIAEIMNATTFTSLRSIISKLVEKQETAKVNSLFSLTETVAALLFHPFYSWTYMRTLNVFSGTVFIISAILVIPALCIVTTFYVQQKITQKKSRKKALEEEEKKESELKKAGPLEFQPSKVATE